MSQAAIDELRTYAQWVAHNKAKAPLGATGFAKVNDKKTWMQSANARAAAINRPDATGVGFVFCDDDPFVGIDLDNAVTEDGTIKPWAQKVVDHWSSYTEMSPSGRGLHIIARGSVPSGTRVEMGDGLLEVYCTGRYFTVTGKHVEGTPTTIQEVDTHGWHTKKFADKPQPKPQAPRREFSTDTDDDLVWVPDALSYMHSDDYDVWVEIGMALKDKFGDAGFPMWDYWSSRAENYAGTYRCRRKWDSFKGYGLTFGTFVQRARDAGYDIPTSESLDTLRMKLSKEDMDAAQKTIREQWLGLTAPVEEPPPVLFDFATMYLDKTPPEPMLVDGLLGPQQILLLSGAPKVGKTFLTAQLAVCAALGKPFLGMPIDKPLNVLHIQYEMSEDAMRQRFQMQKLDNQEVEAIRGHYCITSKKTSDYLTLEYLEKIQAALTFVPDIIIIDPLINAFVGDENSAGDMSAFVHKMKVFCHAISENASIVLTHHSSKAGQIRGSSALRGFYDAGLTLTHVDGSPGVVCLTGEYRHKEAGSSMNLRLVDGVFTEAVTEDDRAGVAAMLASMTAPPMVGYHELHTYIRMHGPISKPTLEKREHLDALGITRNEMRDALKSLANDMKIRRLSDFTWRVSG